MIVIGIDPDSDKHGVAEYWDGELVNLWSLSLPYLVDFLSNIRPKDDLEVHIEDVTGVSAAFNARDKRGNIHIKLKMAQSIGMCKQSQIEIEKFCEEMNIKVVKHKISKAWKKDKALFEKVTGWKGQSNEDTRSAAYFGYLGLNKS
jgi:hypothetical protein